jgi:hypothetical protein
MIFIHFHYKGKDVFVNLKSTKHQSGSPFISTAYVVEKGGGLSRTNGLTND